MKTFSLKPTAGVVDRRRKTYVPGVIVETGVGGMHVHLPGSSNAMML